MSIDDIGGMTLPQLACRAADKPPSSGGPKVKTLAAYEATIAAAEAAWRGDA